MYECLEQHMFDGGNTNLTVAQNVLGKLYIFIGGIVPSLFFCKDGDIKRVRRMSSTWSSSCLCLRSQIKGLR